MRLPACSHSPFLSTLPARGATGLLCPSARYDRHFYPRSPRGERRDPAELFEGQLRISIHAPREGSDARCGGRRPAGQTISIHAPREGSDDRRRQAGGRLGISIHAPREGSDCRRRRPTCWPPYFYPRSPRGERLQQLGGSLDAHAISIHAPREGSDYRSSHWGPRSSMISIHAPREGSDPAPRPTMQKQVLFLSTLPARGATARSWCRALQISDFYPRSPRGERRCSCRERGAGAPHNFYPRSPRGERLTSARTAPDRTRFLSTLPARGATPTQPPAR